jgi:hypothetical protein
MVKTLHGDSRFDATSLRAEFDADRLEVDEAAIDAALEESRP